MKAKQVDKTCTYAGDVHAYAHGPMDPITLKQSCELNASSKDVRRKHDMRCLCCKATESSTRTTRICLGLSSKTCKRGPLPAQAGCSVFLRSAMSTCFDSQLHTYFLVSKCCCTHGRAMDLDKKAPRDLHSARRAVSQEKLDVLVYPDVGMEPLTYFLAFARLAPVQVCSHTPGCLSAGAAQPIEGVRTLCAASRLISSTDGHVVARRW